MLDAMQVAINAQHTADLALQEQAGHERLCSERYANINAGIADLKREQSKANEASLSTTEKLYIAMNEMRTQITQSAISAAASGGRMRGADKAVHYACLAIGAAGALYGILK